jgi:5-(aminomethyl)-3-furanmethanol phosphate kinase
MLTPHNAICDVFLKVGGSILDNAPHTAALAEGLVTLPPGQRVVILTGGGRVAKRIKANQRERSCDFESCWKATTLALDVNAGLLASHSTRFCVTSSISQIIAAHEAGVIPIFAPAGALFNSLWFTPNWIVTTDTMGLYFAHHMGAARYVIVTDVDGVCEGAPGPGSSVSPISKMHVTQLENLPSSKLDAAFPGFFRRYPLETMVVNGKYPARVIGAIFGRRTLGTEVVLDADVAPLTGRDVASKESRDVSVRGQSRAVLCQDPVSSSAPV